MVINLRVPKKMSLAIERAMEEFDAKWEGLPLSRNDVVILLLQRALATLTNTPIVDVLPPGGRLHARKAGRTNGKAHNGKAHNGSRRASA